MKTRKEIEKGCFKLVRIGDEKTYVENGVGLLCGNKIISSDKKNPNPIFLCGNCLEKIDALDKEVEQK